MNYEAIDDKFEHEYGYSFIDVANNQTEPEKKKFPFHEVVKTKRAVYIDDKRISCILTDSVKVEPTDERRPDGNVVVTLSFIAKSYKDLTNQSSDKF